MISRIQRPLSDKEKRLLHASISSMRRRMSEFNKRTLVFSLFLFGIPWGLTMLAAKESWIVITIAWLCICIGISLWSIIGERHKCLKRIASAQDALNTNEADIMHIESKEMIEFKEIEDEGACYLFQVDDENVIMIAGQDFYPSAQFPNNDFEIIRIYDSARNLIEMLIEKHGEKLTPVRIVSAEIKKKLRLPQHLEMVKGKLADFEQVFKA